MITKHERLWAAMKREAKRRSVPIRVLVLMMRNR